MTIRGETNLRHEMNLESLATVQGDGANTWNQKKNSLERQWIVKRVFSQTWGKIKFTSSCEALRKRVEGDRFSRSGARGDARKREKTSLEMRFARRCHSVRALDAL